MMTTKMVSFSSLKSLSTLLIRTNRVICVFSFSASATDKLQVKEDEPPSKEPRLSATHLLNILAGVDLSEVDDIDADDREDCFQCLEYIDDIFDMLFAKEAQDKPNPGYIDLQKELNYKMRGILVDWMVDVGVNFNLLSETVFLGVRMMDIFLSKKQVSRARMQLVGIAAMVIASKFEEVRTPYLEDWIWISAEAYNREQIIRMERIMLETLDYNMGTPTPLHFLRRFSKVRPTNKHPSILMFNQTCESFINAFTWFLIHQQKAAKSDSKTHTLSKYLTELTLPDYNMLSFPPSVIAASAVYLARLMMNKTPTWVTMMMIMMMSLHTSFIQLAMVN